MLDAAYIRDNLEAVKANCTNRNVDPVPVDRVVSFDDERKRLVQIRSETAARQNELSKKFPQAKSPEEKQSLRDESNKLKEEIAAFDAKLKLVEDDLRYNLLLIPNMTHPAAPVGRDAAAN
jgi:seryl-tRNA synthetase